MQNPFRLSNPTLPGTIAALEPLSPVHREGLKAAANDPRIWQFLHADGSTPAGFSTWFEGALAAISREESVVFAVRDLRAGALVGVTGFKKIFIDHDSVSYGSTWLSPAVWGSGINSAIRLQVLRYLFEELDINRCEFYVHIDNIRNHRVLQRLKITKEGLLREAWRTRSGEYVDLVLYSLLSGEWPETREILHQENDRRSDDVKSKSV